MIATIVGLGRCCVRMPAEMWIAKLPEGIPRILERLRFYERLSIRFGHFWRRPIVFWSGRGPAVKPAGPLDGGAILSSVFAGTRSFASGLFTTVIFLYSCLFRGDSFLRRLVESCPGSPASGRRSRSPRSKSDTIFPRITSASPASTPAAGAATALVMWWTGVGDPVLYGTVAFILNYVPIIGPAAAILIFLFAGSLTITSTWQALLPAALLIARSM